MPTGKRERESGENERKGECEWFLRFGEYLSVRLTQKNVTQGPI